MLLLSTTVKLNVMGTPCEDMTPCSTPQPLLLQVFATQHVSCLGCTWDAESRQPQNQSLESVFSMVHSSILEHAVFPAAEFLPSCLTIWLHMKDFRDFLLLQFDSLLDKANYPGRFKTTPHPTLFLFPLPSISEANYWSQRWDAKTGQGLKTKWLDLATQKLDKVNRATSQEKVSLHYLCFHFSSLSANQWTI